MTSSMLHDWPRALRLLTRLFATDADPATLKRTHDAMTDSDWRHFTELAVDRHRIAPMALQQLPRINPPTEVAALLQTAAQNNAIHVLAQVAALRSLKRAMDEAGLSFSVLKGWPLAEQLFNTSSARTARDIDILVAPSDVSDVAAVLKELGYQADPDHPAHARLIGTSALMQETNNVSFNHTGSGLMIELHWRSNQFAGWPELFDAGRNIAEIETSIGSLNVPTPQANLLYLCIHGSMHRWSRLKWLLDIAALARLRGTQQLAKDIEFSRELHASRPVELGLHLANILFATPCPDTRLTKGSWLPRQCLSELARPEAVPKGLGQRMKFYAMMMATADGIHQQLGVFRYRFWGKNRIAITDARRAA